MFPIVQTIGSTVAMLNLLNNKPVPPNEFLRLVSEKTAPNFLWSDDTRCENRNNRTIAVSVSPWEKNKPSLERVRVGITKDISDHGLCIICPFTIDQPEAVVGIYVPQTKVKEPLFFRVDVTMVRSFARGYWQIGMRAVALLNTTHRRQLKSLIPLALDLLAPPTGADPKDD
jgi:hypothetical protein